MADLSLVTANRVRVVESIEQATLPAAEAITAGQAVRIDTTTGKFTKANGTSAAEANHYGIATRTVAAGEALTALRWGVLDGLDLSGLDYSDPVYLSNTDGTLADAAGTVATLIGRVIPGTAITLGTALDKLLAVAPPTSATIVAEDYAEVTLTSAQVKALKATPITIVAAPGVDLAVVPVAVNVVVNYGGTNAFTETADDLSIGYAGGAELMEIESTGLIDQTNDEWRYITLERDETFIPEENKAIVITNLDDEIAGNAANDNTVKVRVYYRTVPTDA